MAVSWQEGDLLWAPGEARNERSRLTEYAYWLRRAWGLSFTEYEALWRWSVEHPGEFWQSVWDHFGLRAHTLPGGLPEGQTASRPLDFFPGATLNYAEHALLHEDDRSDERLALIHRTEGGHERRYTRAQLRKAVARAATGLRALGVGPGDRVVASLPAGPAALIAFLAAASLGATWSACAPERDPAEALARLSPLEPKVLVTVDGFTHEGRDRDRREAVARLRAGLPSLRATVRVDRLGLPLEGEAFRGGSPVLDWEELLQHRDPLTYEPVPLDHPLWTFGDEASGYLSRGHGEVLLEHLVALALQADLGPGDRLLWPAATDTLPWGLAASALLLDATLILYEGSPAYPDLGALWRLCQDTGVTCFGAEAGYLAAVRDQGILPREEADLSRLRSLGVTGPPLPADEAGWIYQAVSTDLLLGSVDAGAVGAAPSVRMAAWLPVHAGRAQCPSLGQSGSEAP